MLFCKISFEHVLFLAGASLNRFIMNLVNSVLFSPGTVDWRSWVLISHGFFLGILLFSLLLACCGYWPSFHHMKVSLNFEARREICQLVEDSWDELLVKTKNVIDAALMDGECMCMIFSVFNAIHFYTSTCVTYSSFD